MFKSMATSPPYRFMDQKLHRELVVQGMRALENGDFDALRKIVMNMHGNLLHQRDIDDDTDVNVYGKQ